MSYRVEQIRAVSRLLSAIDQYRQLSSTASNEEKSAMQDEIEDFADDVRDEFFLELATFDADDNV